jgi:ElaB/YqjD/DUF883 family membrane-anchored ribosome-binding protein
LKYESNLTDASPSRLSFSPERNIPTLRALACELRLGGKATMSTVSSSPSAQSATAKVAETARSTAESVRSTAEDVTKQGQKALSQAGAAATEMAESASKQVTTFASEISKMTRDNPLGALAGATMFGLLIGLLLHGRSNSK